MACNKTLFQALLDLQGFCITQKWKKKQVYNAGFCPLAALYALAENLWSYKEPKGITVSFLLPTVLAKEIIF